MINLKPEFTKRIKRTINFPVFAALFLLVIASCNPSLRFASVRYNAADINRLLDDTGMAYLTIQNNATDAGNYKKPFTLVSYARTGDGGFVSAEPYNLQPQEGRKPKTFIDKTTLADLSLTRTEILSLITDPKTGQKSKDFAYLLFTPLRDKDYGYLYFDVQAINSFGKNINTQLADVIIRPCPPATWCRPTSTKTINQ